MCGDKKGVVRYIYVITIYSGRYINIPIYDPIYRQSYPLERVKLSDIGCLCGRMPEKFESII